MVEFTAVTIVYNIKRMTRRRQSLRRSAPRAELLLWQRLKGKQLLGYKFRRQYSVGGYVIDFYCPEVKLAIEIDGPSHFVSNRAREYDRLRQQFIGSFGIRFIRVTNADVYKNLRGVIDAIMAGLYY